MFKSARLKLDRADKHISDLDSAIRRMPDAYTATIKKDVETRKNIVEYELHDRAALEELGPIIGDAIHNIYCSLDHAWIEPLESSCRANLTGIPSSPPSKLERRLKVAFTVEK